MFDPNITTKIITLYPNPQQEGILYDHCRVLQILYNNLAELQKDQMRKCGSYFGLHDLYRIANQWKEQDRCLCNLYDKSVHSVVRDLLSSTFMSPINPNEFGCFYHIELPVSSITLNYNQFITRRYGVIATNQIQPFCGSIIAARIFRQKDGWVLYLKILVAPSVPTCNYPFLESDFTSDYDNLISHGDYQSTLA